MCGSLIGETGAASLTVFREDAGVTNKMSGDPPGRWHIYVDGHKVGDVGKGQSITLLLSPGKHEVKTERSDRVTIDVAPGGDVFLRPRFYGSFGHWRPSERIDQVSCDEALPIAATTKAAPGDRLFWGEAGSMPESCR